LSHVVFAQHWDMGTMEQFARLDRQRVHALEGREFPVDTGVGRVFLFSRDSRSPGEPST
jgi:hypothetical protein